MMGVYWLYVNDEKQERLEPGDLGDNIKYPITGFTSAVLHELVDSGHWNGFRAVADTSAEYERITGEDEADKAWADITQRVLFHYEPLLAYADWSGGHAVMFVTPHRRTHGDGHVHLAFPHPGVVARARRHLARCESSGGLLDPYGQKTVPALRLRDEGYWVHAYDVPSTGCWANVVVPECEHDPRTTGIVCVAPKKELRWEGQFTEPSPLPTQWAYG